MIVRDVTFKLRRGTAEEWAYKNPVLDYGEPGDESDTLKWKIGDGISRWNDLGYQKGDVDPGDDDGPSLVLLYQNAKV